MPHLICLLISLCTFEREFHGYGERNDNKAFSMDKRELENIIMQIPFDSPFLHENSRFPPRDIEQKLNGNKQINFVRMRLQCDGIVDATDFQTFLFVLQASFFSN